MEPFEFVPKTRQEVANFAHACARPPLQRTAQPENREQTTNYSYVSIVYSEFYCICKYKYGYKSCNIY